MYYDSSRRLRNSYYNIQVKFKSLLLALLITACASASSEPTHEPQIIFITPTLPPVASGTPTDEPLPFHEIASPTLPTVAASPVPPTATLAPVTPTLVPAPTSAPPRPPASAQPTVAIALAQPTLPPAGASAAPPAATALATSLAAQPASDIASAEQAVIDLTNAQRTRYGLPPLARDETIMSIARSRSADMVARNYFGHNDPVTGAHLASDAIQASGFGRAGENIYWSGRGALTDFPSLAVTWFMNDAPHRANILNSSYTSIGVGITWNGQGWVLTQDFGGP